MPALVDSGEGGAMRHDRMERGLDLDGCELDVRNHGLAGEIAAKHGVVGLMRYYATALAEKNIRVNTVHPTGVATPMLINEMVAQCFAEHPDGVEALRTCGVG